MVSKNWEKFSKMCQEHLESDEYKYYIKRIETDYSNDHETAFDKVMKVHFYLVNREFPTEDEKLNKYIVDYYVENVYDA